MAKKKTKKLSRISGILYSSNDAIKVRKKFFNDLKPEHILSNIHNVEEHRFFKTLIRIRRNDDYSDFYTPNNPKTDTIKNLYWYVGVVVINEEIINKYLEHERRLNKKIINGDFSDAIAILDSVDDLIGISYASMSIRGGILSIIDDVDGLNELSDKINQNAKDNDFAKTLAKNIISRYEDSDVFISNSDSFRNQIIRHFHGELLHFLLYKLTLKEPLAVYDYEHILNIEKNSSVLDMYICLISFIETFYRFNNNLTDSIVYAIAKLTEVINTPLLSNLSHYYGVKNDYEFSVKDNEYIDLYTSGKYHEVVNYFVEDEYFLDDFQYMEIAAKAAARIGVPELNSLKGRIIKSIVSLMTKDEDYEKSLSYLLCLCHCFYPLRWFGQLRIFVENEAKELNEAQKNNIRELSIIYSRLNSPRKLEVLRGEIYGDYLRQYRQNVGNSLSLLLWTNKDNVLGCSNNELSEVEKGRFNKYVALHHLGNNDYEKAIHVLERLVKDDDILIKNDASKMLIRLYLENEDYEKASNEFVYNCLGNKNLIPYYNSEKICKNLEKIISESDSICVPIVFSLHSRFVNSNYDSALRYSFECFLKINKINTPLEGNVLYDKYDARLVDYFLEYVCTPDIMKLYLYFDSTRKIENCRIDICKYLINKDISKEMLVYEVKERTKKLVITEAAKHVENSRIYSDTSVFHSEITSENILTLYNKYIELAKSDYRDKQDELVLQRLYDKLKNTDIVDYFYSMHILDMPLNEKNKCFISLIRVMRDEFCYGDRGLNNYLSTRIRHGHLPTTLRKPVFDESLITRRQAKSQAFKKNEYWLEKLAGSDERDEKKLDKLFTEFSSEYDKIISEINDKWIQIFTLDQKISLLSSQQTKLEGLFNYSISNVESYIIQQRIPIKTEYSEFVKHVVNWLWSRTDINLKSVREKIDKEARLRLTDSLNRMQKDVNTIVCDEAMLAEFNDAVGRAKASLSASIEQVISWFVRSDEGGIESYDIETAIEIARLSNSVDVDLNIDKGYRLKGNTLTNIVDCLYIFFENAISKSNVNIDELNLNLSMQTVDGQVKLRISNRCQAVADVEASNNALNIYREKYGQSKIEISKLQNEGGTGFFKIWNIVHNGLGLIHTLRFGYDNNDTFSVELSFFNFGKVIDDENINS